ncbi:hypothetical protein KVH02_15575 [Streptomyces olivaceus]|uniref:YcaO domain-containing protein n=1 Tax=Streptomyces olivaceus TaxID=47716 RepID=A0ABS7W441_STROV|nr:DUF6302 family protein [Streptomyces olivaceus]MBZ6089746.1 hypothetical protein [Streptomyces olivaceus]MBZ6098257.1 hypothetical protein [Streptomyces olivaceus]MBZ6119060.1 hypothetical protein [Streptomyces olivaceus]MBZ6152208.1 hypothetical protein [Streptomyces olivaceus]MBZ6300758.1 hypothetical protein [Streptomyces olivaceus]
MPEPTPPPTEPDVTVMPPAEAYDFDYFRCRVDVGLLSRSIAVRVFRIPLLAVPVGGSRRGGWFGAGDLAVALAVRQVLAALNGFPCARVTWQRIPSCSYAVEWGDRPPTTWLDDDERLAFYGLTRPDLDPGRPHRARTSAVSSGSSNTARPYSFGPH